MRVVKSLSHSKMEELEAALTGDHALVHLDARPPEVEVPTHLKSNPALTLKISYLFQGQLNLTEAGIEAYLRFSGNYFQCVIPWNAVWGLTTESGEQKVWNESLPEDLLAKLNQMTEVLPGATTDTQSTTNNNQNNAETSVAVELASSPDFAAESPSESNNTSTREATSKPNKPGLRRIK